MGTFTQKIDKKGRFVLPYELFCNEKIYSFFYTVGIINRANLLTLHRFQDIVDKIEADQMPKSDASRFIFIKSDLKNSVRLKIKQLAGRYSQCQVRGIYDKIEVVLIEDGK